jgi:hypothetical protein
MLLYLWLHTQNQPNIFDNFVFFCSPPHSLLGDFTVSEGHGYPLVYHNKSKMQFVNNGFNILKVNYSTLIIERRENNH